MKKILSLLFVAALLVSCGEKPNQTAATSAENPVEHQHMTPAENTGQVGIGDIVPNDLVCMVNNDYMGREQLEVVVNDKIYYGCCEMCQNRLPVDESVRVAVDPVSNKQVDKADAVIAITGERGKVSYFENKENYEKYKETVLNL